MRVLGCAILIAVFTCGVVDADIYARTSLFDSLQKAPIVIAIGVVRDEGEESVVVGFDSFVRGRCESVPVKIGRGWKAGDKVIVALRKTEAGVVLAQFRPLGKVVLRHSSYAVRLVSESGKERSRTVKALLCAEDRERFAQDRALQELVAVELDVAKLPDLKGAEWEKLLRVVHESDLSKSLRHAVALQLDLHVEGQAKRKEDLVGLASRLMSDAKADAADIFVASRFLLRWGGAEAKEAVVEDLLKRLEGDATLADASFMLLRVMGRERLGDWLEVRLRDKELKESIRVRLRRFQSDLSRKSQAPGSGG